MTVPEIELAAGYLVKRVQHSFRRRSDAALQAVGVSMAQYAARRQLGRRRRLAYATLAGCDYDNFTHLVSYLSIGSMTIWPSLMEARSGRVGRSLAAGVLSGARAMRSAMRICVGTRQSAITKASWLP